MEKIINKDFRKTKQFKLPVSGLTVEIYSSVLVKDTEDTTEKMPEFDKNLNILVKTIKSWNLFASEKDENPMPITLENIKTLPAPDFEFLANGFTEFASEQKKS